MAHLDKEVALMPKGLETQTGEAGLGLSGDQVQRPSLAHALLADRPVLLLNEPADQVDLASETAIVEPLEKLARGRIVVAISHRVGVLTTADRAVRVEAGVVHDAGGAETPGPASMAAAHEAAQPEAREVEGSFPQVTDKDRQEEPIWFGRSSRGGPRRFARGQLTT